MRLYTQVVAASLVATLAIVDSKVSNAIAGQGNNLRFLRQDNATVARVSEDGERGGLLADEKDIMAIADHLIRLNYSLSYARKVLGKFANYEYAIAKVEEKIKKRTVSYMFLDEKFLTQEEAEGKFIEWILEGKTQEQLEREFDIFTRPESKRAKKIQEVNKFAIRAYLDWLRNLRARSFRMTMMEYTNPSNAFATFDRHGHSRNKILSMFDAWVAKGTLLDVVKDRLGFNKPMKPADMFHSDNFVAYATYAQMLREKNNSLRPPRLDSVSTPSN
uniref:Secreted RxLR effector protein 40 n=1 Tax=Plasmopara viticola TaxID=143451 RepID=RLR40_PLAVT|nr:RecName: Full=Secreted RxLR effector protein 40; Flags: Precursor [Plasmopara viticola]